MLRVGLWVTLDDVSRCSHTGTQTVPWKHPAAQGSQDPQAKLGACAPTVSGVCVCACTHPQTCWCADRQQRTRNPRASSTPGARGVRTPGAARGTSSTPTQADATPGAFKDLSAERSACPAHSAAAWAPKHQAVADRRITCHHSCQGGAECHPVPPPSSPLTCATHMARLRVPTKTLASVPAEHGPHTPTYPE